MRAAFPLALILALGLSAEATAQPQGVFPEAKIPTEPYTSPRIKDTWGARLLEQPDITGAWMLTALPAPTSNEYAVRVLMFDPATAVIVGMSDSPPPGPPPGSRNTTIPYNAEWQARYDKIVQDTLEGRSIDPVGACEPYGFPRYFGGRPGAFSIVQSPTAILMVTQDHPEPRAIYLDNRPPPEPRSEFEDSRTEHGHSLGRWEGDTLVVVTTHLTAGYFDQTDPPYSDQLKVTERIRRIGPDMLEVKMTLEDPVAFTRPWEVTRYLARAPQSFVTLGSHYCEPQDMSLGYQSPVLPQERESQ